MHRRLPTLFGWPPSINHQEPWGDAVALSYLYGGIADRCELGSIFRVESQSWQSCHAPIRVEC